MASILQLTDSAYFACFKTQFHNIVAGQYSTVYIHVESCHVVVKTYCLNIYTIFEYLCNKCFQNFFVTNQKAKFMAHLLYTLVWDCTRPIEIRFGRLIMCIVGLNKSRHQYAMMPWFVTLHTEWLMYPSLIGVCHFPGNNRHLNYSTMKALNLAPKSLFSGHWSCTYYGEFIQCKIFCLLVCYPTI
jgi:hypothetical protein